VYINTQIPFRDEQVVLSPTTEVVYKTTYGNPYVSYSLVTEQLVQGTHKWEVQTKDNLNNTSDNVAGSVAIADYRLPPRFIAYSYVDRHHVNLTWTEPADTVPDNYVVYSNNGSGSIDTGSHYDVLSGSTLEVEYNLEVNGTWKFRVEALRDGVESNTKYEVWIIVPKSAVAPPAVNDENKRFVSISAENVSVGKLKVTFVWLYGNAASSFRIYHDNGTGTISYGSYIEFTRQNGYVQTYTTGQIYSGSEDQEFLFVIRAVSSDSVEESNTVENSVDLDGVAPDEIEELAIGSTF